MKIYSLFVASFLFANVAAAQGISGGIKGGLNIANQKATVEFSGLKVSTTSDPRASFHLGGYLNIPFAAQWSFQPELLYNNVGAKNELDGTRYTTRASYISVPMIIKFNPVPLVSLQAGPQVGILIAAEDDSGDVSVDTKDTYNQFDFGIALGAGLDLSGGLNFSARYVFGLANIADPGELDGLDDFNVSAKNNVFQLSVGYRLFGKPAASK